MKTTKTKVLWSMAGAAVLCSFAVTADDAEWTAVVTSLSSGSGANTRYNSDLHFVGKSWNTANCWAGGAVPATTLDTVYITNTVTKSYSYQVQPISWANDLTITKLVGNPLHYLSCGTDAKIMTIGDASEFDGVLRSMAASSASKSPAGYAFSASTTVPRFAADGIPQLKVEDAGHTVDAKSVYGRGTIVKTGNGTLKISDGSYQAKVRLQGGKLELPGHSYPDELVAGYEGNFDASADGALVTAEGGDGRTYVTRWNATNSDQYYFKTTNDVMRPYLRENYANGRSVVDFGAFRCTNTQSPGIGEERWTELGQPAWMEAQKTLTMKSVFYVQEETSRTNNGAVAFGNRAGTVFYRMFDTLAAGYVSPTWSGVLAGWYESTAMQHGDMRVNNMRVPHDHYEPGGFARMMVYSQAEWAPEPDLLYIHMLGSDRYARFGGMRLGQLVSYKTVLTAEQIRQNNAHLAKKWLGPVAEAVDADVGAVFVTKNANTITVPTGATSAVPALVGGPDASNGVVKDGAGTLVLDELNLEGVANLTVKGGKVAFRDLVAKTAPADDAPAVEPCFWLKADEDTSLVTETENGTNFVSRWNDCRGNGRYAYVPTSYGNYTPEKPFLTVNAANGKPVVDFGFHADYAAGKIPAMLFNREGLGGAVNGVRNAMEAFVMFRHKDHEAYQSWIFTSSSGAEFVNSFDASSANTKHRILNVDYANRRTLGADWFRDGRRIDPQDTVVDSDYHVLNFASFDNLPLESLSIDRWSQYTTRGGGIEIGEYIVFDRILTDAERRQTEAYLLKKWKNMAHPRTAARKLDTLEFAEGVTPEIENEGDTEIFAIKTTATALKLTGSGTITLSSPLPRSITTIDAGDVKLRIGDADVGARIIHEKAVFNLDASRADTMTFDANDATRVLEWRDANGGDYVAVKSHLASNTPQLTDVTINGEAKKAICLFDWCQTATGANASDYQSPTGLTTGFDVRKTTAASWTVTGGFDAQEFFVVMADYESADSTKTHRANHWDSAPNNSPVPYRDTENKGYIIRMDYGREPNYTMRVMLDGAEVEANRNVKTNRGQITDFNFHVVTLSVTNSTTTVHTSTVGWTKTGGTAWIWAGKTIAELVAFKSPLSDYDRVLVHDYLRRKWLSVQQPVPDSGELAFTFTAPDQVGAITVSDDLVLPANLTVRLAVSPTTMKLEPGDYVLLTANSIAGGSDITVVADLAGAQKAVVVKDGNTLKVRILSSGTVFLFR